MKRAKKANIIATRISLDVGFLTKIFQNALCVHTICVNASVGSCSGSPASCAKKILGSSRVVWGQVLSNASVKVFIGVGGALPPARFLFGGGAGLRIPLSLSTPPPIALKDRNNSLSFLVPSVYAPFSAWALSSCVQFYFGTCALITGWSKWLENVNQKSSGDNNKNKKKNTVISPNIHHMKTLNQQ